MSHDPHRNWEEQIIALPPGKWIPGRHGVLRYEPTGEPNLDWIAHGTEDGYQKEVYRNIKPCDDCRTTHTAHVRERRGGKARKQAACGTVSGYARHRRNQEMPCQECVEATRIRGRERRNRKAAA